MPTRHNDGHPIEWENYLWVGEELAAQFGAFTLEPQSLQGVWIHQGIRYEETNLRMFVDIDDTPANEAFFVRFKEALKHRFDQIDIWVVSYEIRRI